MKAMEEEVLIKSGEIRILRDSLHRAESVLEEQRRSQLLLEQEKARALGDREREFSRKVTALPRPLAARRAFGGSGQWPESSRRCQQFCAQYFPPPGMRVLVLGLRAWHRLAGVAGLGRKN